MIQTVTILVGLPGSGKTTFLDSRSERIFDDFHGNAFGDSPDFSASRHYSDLGRAIEDGYDCIISDIAYCEESRLLATEEGLRLLQEKLGTVFVVNILYFEKDPDACRHNVVHRFSRQPTRKYLNELKNIDELSKVLQSTPRSNASQNMLPIKG